MTISDQYICHLSVFIVVVVVVLLQLDKDELEEAKWFSRQEVIQLLNRQHPLKYFVPPDNAIAHQLIRTWVNMTSNL